MARYGFGSDGGFCADSAQRVPEGGVGKLVFEVVKVKINAGSVTIYNKNKSAYGTAPTNATTGAAILKDIKFVVWAGPSYEIDSDGALASTTTALMATVNYLNGPTTVLKIHSHTNASAVLMRILVCGKSF